MGEAGSGGSCHVSPRRSERPGAALVRDHGPQGHGAGRRLLHHGHAPAPDLRVEAPGLGRLPRHQPGQRELGGRRQALRDLLESGHRPAPVCGHHGGQRPPAVLRVCPGPPGPAALRVLDRLLRGRQPGRADPQHRHQHRGRQSPALVRLGGPCVHALLLAVVRHHLRAPELQEPAAGRHPGLQQTRLGRHQKTTAEAMRVQLALSSGTVSLL
uniref:Transmembrane protein 217 isoform 1 n=1 Tax=Heterocephalus glaber TaxID=10181 RepID=A0A0P6JSY9_HETGA